MCLRSRHRTTRHTGRGAGDGHSGIPLVDRPFVQVELPSDEARSREGVACLDSRGFLLVTDKFPSTTLAFVSGP